MAEVIDFDPYKDLPPVVRQFIGTPYEAKALRAYEEGRQEAIAKAKKEGCARGIEAARNRAIGLAKIHFGEAEGARFAAIVESGMSAEQYRNLRPQLPEIGECPELTALRVVTTNLSQPADDGADFMRVVERTMESEGIGKTAAMAKVSAAQPDLHKRYIQSRNPGMEV